ncbi:MAG: phosphatase PAP2 family protein [Oscillospiraceae bacterium]|nr:phosphatase PAP2 family protein [Oscillospiraceae bacterium]
MFVNFFAILAEGFDLPILDWIQANLANPVLDKIMPYITMLGNGGIFWIACALIMMAIPKTRKTGLGMAFALIFGLVICNITLKPLIGRIRPYDYQSEFLNTTITLLVKTPHDFSFPSGHTIASFEAATVILLNGKKLGIPAMILAVLIAFSRLYLYVHYPTDVIASVILGVLFAVIGNLLAHKLLPGTPGRKGRYQK